MLHSGPSLTFLSSRGLARPRGVGVLDSGSCLFLHITFRLETREGGTHDSVWRRGAADEALDLSLLPMQGMLSLCAGDDRRP